MIFTLLFTDLHDHEAGLAHVSAPTADSAYDKLNEELEARETESWDFGGCFAGRLDFVSPLKGEHFYHIYIDLTDKEPSP